MAQTPPGPTWFHQALETPCESHNLTVAGVPIHYLSWGMRNRPGILMVHGGLAHAHWWRITAPFFAQSHFVVALDLSGHGASGWQSDGYRVSQWLAEIEAMRLHAGFAGKPVLIGHSMGGLLSLAAALKWPEYWAGTVINDAPVHQPLGHRAEGQRGKSYRHIQPYPDLQAAKARFKLLPHQPCEHGFLLDFLAETSLKETDEGWIWKFDPAIFEALETGPWQDWQGCIRGPAAFIRGQWSAIVPPDLQPFLAKLAAGPFPLIEIPAAHHHVMLDQPLAFASVLRSLCALWQHD